MKHGSQLSESGPRFHTLTTKQASSGSARIFTSSPFSRQTLLVQALLKTYQEPFGARAAVGRQAWGWMGLHLPVNLRVPVSVISHTLVTTSLSAVPRGSRLRTRGAARSVSDCSSKESHNFGYLYRVSLPHPAGSASAPGLVHNLHPGQCQSRLQNNKKLLIYT